MWVVSQYAGLFMRAAARQATALRASVHPFVQLRRILARYSAHLASLLAHGFCTTSIDSCEPLG